MGQRLILTLLMLGILASACVSGPAEDEAPAALAEETIDEVFEEMPEVGEVTEEELTPEVDLAINDTVDLGSLL